MMVPYAQVAADNTDDPRMVFTPESTPTACGAWTEARQTQSVRAGLWGFLSGMNLQSDSSGTDPEGLTAWSVLQSKPARHHYRSVGETAGAAKGKCGEQH